MCYWKTFMILFTSQDNISANFLPCLVVLACPATVFKHECGMCVFPVAVELLILSHECFSLTCNMEGIVKVLQAARHLSHAHLAHGEGYGLLVSISSSKID